MDSPIVELAKAAREEHAGVTYKVGEDRSSHYPECVCHDRHDGGPALHPGAPFDCGPCYFTDDCCDPGFYPE